MLRKTTVYLSDDDLRILRKMANIKNITVAEAIRFSIKDACKPSSPAEKQVWEALDKLWAKMTGLNPQRIENVVDAAVKEVRGGRKARRRS